MFYSTYLFSSEFEFRNCYTFSNFMLVISCSTSPNSHAHEVRRNLPHPTLARKHRILPTLETTDLSTPIEHAPIKRIPNPTREKTPSYPCSTCVSCSPKNDEFFQHHDPSAPRGLDFDFGCDGASVENMGRSKYKIPQSECFCLSSSTC